MLCGLMQSVYYVIIKDETIAVSCDPNEVVSFSDYEDPADGSLSSKMETKNDSNVAIATTLQIGFHQVEIIAKNYCDDSADLFFQTKNKDKHLLRRP